MKSASAGLLAHQAAGSTTIARCWRFERRDAVVVTVTTCARDLFINGEVYYSKDGVNPTSVEQQTGASVQNSEVNGTLSDDLASEAEILQGLWDGAFVTIFEVNYRDLTQGVMNLQSGTLGDVKVGRSSFNAEVRGIAQGLQQTVGDLYTAACTATFGDARCKKVLGPLTVTGALTLITDRRNFADSSRAEATDYFGGGLITFTSGLNVGVSIELAGFAATAFATVLPLPFNPAVGDTYSLIPGCRKRFTEDCKTKWNNVVNFRGFPHVPGGDKVLGLGGTEGTNL